MITVYENLEDMLDGIRVDIDRANAQVLPWQEALKPGDKFIYASEGIGIVGEVLPNAGKTEAELAAMDPEEAAEYREEAEIYNEPHMKHMRFSRCFSEVCPRGEVGDVHVARILKQITDIEFEALRQTGWDLEAILKHLV